MQIRGHLLVGALLLAWLRSYERQKPARTELAGQYQRAVKVAVRFSFGKRYRQSWRQP